MGVSPACLPGEVPVCLAPDIAFLLQLTDPPPRRHVLVSTEPTASPAVTPARPVEAPPSMLIISPDPAAQRLTVDAQVVGDHSDRRARPRPIQRDRIGLELLRVVPRNSRAGVNLADQASVLQPTRASSRRLAR